MPTNPSWPGSIFVEGSTWSMHHLLIITVTPDIHRPCDGGGGGQKLLFTNRSKITACFFCRTHPRWLLSRLRRQKIIRKLKLSQNTVRPIAWLHNSTTPTSYIINPMLFTADDHVQNEPATDINNWKAS